MPKGKYKHKSHSDETKRKMSLSHIGMKNSLGCKRSEEVKRKISLALKGRIIGPMSSETKRKISEVNKGKSKFPNGRVFTEQWKQNMSIAGKKKKQSPEGNLKRSIALKGIRKPPCTEQTKQKRRENRSKQKFPLWDSIPEKKMHELLIRVGIIFEKHKHIPIEHKYLCDIFIAPNIVIEVDGVYWHNYPHGREIDVIRTKEMEEVGYKVLRFWDKDILNNSDFVLKKIKEEVQNEM